MRMTGSVSGCWKTWRTRRARRIQRAIILAMVPVLAYAGYQAFGPTPYHAYWRFSRALAAGDRHTMYSMQTPLWPGKWGVPES